jgi:hypothetical protein
MKRPAEALAILFLVIGCTYGLSSYRDRQNEEACRANLASLALACQGYATAEGRGRYPTRLEQLVPRYIASLPTCPDSGNSIPYTEGYRMWKNPDRFTISCHLHKNGKTLLSVNSGALESP